jgi:predicted small metal-binding protein
MKTMTCAEMGGMCDTPITGSTSDEMVSNGMKHIESTHPDMAASIKSMPKDDPKMVAWFKTFMEKWNTTPDSN